MKKFIKMNAKALLINFLIISIGYCFGHRIGVGIALVLVLLMQIF